MNTTTRFHRNNKPLVYTFSKLLSTSKNLQKNSGINRSFLIIPRRGTNQWPRVIEVLTLKVGVSIYSIAESRLAVNTV